MMDKAMDQLSYVSVSHLRVDPQRVDDLIAAFRARAGLVDCFEGFEGLEVWRSDRTPGEIMMISRWRCRADFSTYMKSQEHRISHDRIPDDLEAAIRLERLEHLKGYEVVAR